MIQIHKFNFNWGTDYAPNPYFAWIFMFHDSDHHDYYNSDPIPHLSALAVHPGDILAASVPEPVTIVMLCTGLVGLVGFARKKFKK